MSRLCKLLRLSRERGLAWTLLWSLRTAVEAVHRQLLALLDPPLATIERRRFLVASNTLSARGNTIAENRDRWTRWNWRDRGNEWTEDAAAFRTIDPDAWKRDILERFMLAHVRKGGATLEIGPGAGRWTAHLLELSDTVQLADISQKCLDLCRERFGDRVGVHLVENGRLDFLSDDSIDFVWSYDVFVHVNPVDADVYLAELRRVLRPGARAVIHHADEYPSHRARVLGFRSNLSADFFRELCRRNDLQVIEQDKQHAHKPGDCISVLERASTR